VIKVLKTLAFGEAFVEDQMDDSDPSVINDFQERVAENIQKAKLERELLQQHLAILESTANEAGGMLWRKDADHCYLYANRYHCRHFFGLPAHCIGMIRGKSDLELANDYIERTGEWHGFADLCWRTDNHARDLRKRAVYVEVGVIGREERVLKVIKTPLFRDGIFIGTVGFAMDLTFDCAGVFATIEIGIQNGAVEPLEDQIYWIKDPDTCGLDRRRGQHVLTWAREMAAKFTKEINHE